MKHKLALSAALALTLFLTGCSSSQQSAPANNNQKQAQQQNQQQQQTQIANPASTNCTDKGGTLQIETRPDGGQYGVCYFDDNRQCEEWALFRGECPVGGVKVTGYDNAAQRFCAISGGSTFTSTPICTFPNGATCDNQAFYEGKCEVAYNNADLKFIQVPAADIQVGYSKATVSEDGSSQLSVITVNTLTVADQPAEAPMDSGKTTMEAEQAALAKGRFGEENDFVVDGSQKVVRVSSNINAKTFAVLGRFEVCDVVFDQVMVFYQNGEQVNVTLAGNKEKIMAENPTYFAADNTNCSGQMTWNYTANADVQKQFWQDLQSGKIKGTASTWNSDFQTIVQNTKNAPADPATMTDEQKQMAFNQGCAALGGVVDNGIFPNVHCKLADGTVCDLDQVLDEDCLIN